MGKCYFSKEEAKKAFDEIIVLHMQGVNITDACKQVNFPRSSFYVMLKDKNNLDAYRDSQQVYVESRLSNMLAAADKLYNTSEDAHPLEHQRIKVALWADTWALSRLNKVMYGDKVSVDANVNVNVSDVVNEARNRVIKLKDNLDDNEDGQ